MNGHVCSDRIDYNKVHGGYEFRERIEAGDPLESPSRLKITNKTRFSLYFKL